MWEWLGQGRLMFRLAGLLVLMIANDVHAMKPVKPGEVPTLGANEGFVLMAVDTPVDVHNVRMNRDGKTFGSAAIRDLKKGRNFRLYVASAGLYEWRQLQLFYDMAYTLSDDPDFQFKVEPGRITYPGDLLFQPVTVWRANFAMSNRGLAAIDWMMQQHAAIYERYEFAYAGRYPDPFPAFYKPLRAAAKAQRVSQADMLDAPAAAPLPIPVDALFKPSRIRQATLNASGTMLALHVRNDKEDWGVELVELATGRLSVLGKSAVPFETLEWSGDGVLLMTLDKPMGLKMVTVVKVGVDASGKRSYTRIDMPREGFVVDSLPAEPDHILFGSLSREGSLLIHRIDISSQKAVDDFRFAVRDRLNQGLKDDVAWYTDGNGRLRLATVKRGEDYVLMRQEGVSFHDVMTLSGETDFDPVGISFDASLIYGLTDEGRGQRDLVEYDLVRKQITRTLFSRPGVDVSKVLFDARRAPIGVQYYQGGALISDYFETDDARLGALLQKAFPDRMVQVVDRSRDGRHAVLYVDAADRPTQVFYLDSVKGVAELIDDAAPWLSKIRFAPAQTIRFKGRDGLALEAFLTLPAGQGNRPLVVFPHGGPVGVADSLHFDREVQLIASLGYAVLQVNFRGSEGYGRAFREAAYGGYGTVIEDDIDAAIKAALARHPLDESRMCMVGASYGGYSALVAATRWPDRFRCAVSIAGVSDRILFFTASDSARVPKLRERLEKMMGNPHTDMLQMQQTSPLYQYTSIRVPVMLAHGLEDQRVDYEHSRRIARMLHLAGNTPVGLSFEEEGHGFDKPENQAKLWNGVAAFLRQHLGNPLPVAVEAPKASSGAP